MRPTFVPDVDADACIDQGSLFLNTGKLVVPGIGIVQRYSGSFETDGDGGKMEEDVERSDGVCVHGNSPDRASKRTILHTTLLSTPAQSSQCE